MIKDSSKYHTKKMAKMVKRKKTTSTELCSKSAITKEMHHGNNVIFCLFVCT